ncbi:MAG: anti-sigma factor family protein [Planctomycetota bacterium]
MKCRDALALLRALFDGELGPTRREPLERHLEACASCREALAECAAISRALRSASADVPVVTRAAIDHWARKALEERVTTIRWLRRVAAVAAALLVASLAAFWSLSLSASEEAGASAAVHRESALEIVLGGPDWQGGEF